MEFQRIIHSFSILKSHAKLILSSSLILTLSAFLPWYADLDSYRSGDQFLGVTGPTSFIGIFIVLFGAGSFFVALQNARGKRVKLPFSAGILHIFLGAQSLLLLLIVNSIYFHPKFGVNITLKESRFGMIIAVGAALVLVIGAYMKYRDEYEETDEIGRLEPLIKIEDLKSNVTPGMSMPAPSSIREHSPMRELSKESPEKKRIQPVVRGRQLEGFTFAADPEQVALRKRVEQKEHNEGGVVNKQQWRVDL